MSPKYKVCKSTNMRRDQNIKFASQQYEIKMIQHDKYNMIITSLSIPLKGVFGKFQYFDEITYFSTEFADCIL